MSITASTCITFTGYEPLGSTLTLYSNIDNFTSPFGTVLLTSITGNSCPYIMSGIPDGTTSIQLKDPVSLCCTTIFLQNNNLCVNCTLDFDIYETQTVSQIVAGNLVGSCDDNITDYIINWYGPEENSTNIAFTSGYGTVFQNVGWDLTHPLTGSFSPLVESGTYRPVIERVIINGITYSSSGGTGVYPANLDCFNSAQVTVEPLRCDNGNNLGDYSHHYLFDNVSVSNPPESLSASFLLSANTNYLAWQFRGFQRYDTIKLIFYGSEYGNIPLTIENARIGSEVGTPNVGVDANPKLINSDYFIKKVTCLTGLTINEGDYITIQITPNPTTFNTKWDFYFTCLETFNCTTCYDQFQNSSPKIDLSTVSTNLLSCNKVEINLSVSGCNYNDLASTDVGKYFYNVVPNTIASLRYNLFGGVNVFWFTQESCIYNVCNYTASRLCGPVGQTYQFSKSIVNGVGLVTFTFNSITDLQFYYSSYQSLITCLGGGDDNTQIDYYRAFELHVPVPNNPNEQCGDTTPAQLYYFHHTSVVTTGGTGPFTMTLTMPTVVNNINFTNCQANCSYYIPQQIDYINSSSLSQNNNLTFITNTGSKWTNPFRNGWYFTIDNSSRTISVDEDYITNWQFQNETYVYSGNNVLVSSLTGKTCDYKGLYSSYFYSSGGYGYFQYSGAWKIEITNPNDLTEFELLVAPINNWTPSLSGQNLNFNTTALTYSNGSITYSNPDYTF